MSEHQVRRLKFSVLIVLYVLVTKPIKWTSSIDILNLYHVIGIYNVDLLSHYIMASKIEVVEQHDIQLEVLEFQKMVIVVHFDFMHLIFTAFYG